MLPVTEVSFCLFGIFKLHFIYLFCIVMEASVEVRGQFEGVGFLLVHPISHSPTLLLRSSNVYRVSISSSFKFFSLTHFVLLNPKKGKPHWLPHAVSVWNASKWHTATEGRPSFYSACLWFSALCLRLLFVCFVCFPTLDFVEVLETGRSSCQLLSSQSHWVASQLPKIQWDNFGVCSTIHTDRAHCRTHLWWALGPPTQEKYILQGKGSVCC